MWTRTLVVLLLALAAALAGCGGDDDPSGGKSEQELLGPAPTGTSEQQLQETWRRYYTGLGRRDGGAVCVLLTDNGQEEVVKESSGTGGSCEEVVAVLGTFFKGYRSRLEDVQVSGDSATAVAPRSGDIQAQRIEFKRDGGRWKIDSSQPE